MTRFVVMFLCMLAYYVEWHMREKLAPVLFDDHERDKAEATRASIVEPAPRSKAARAKDGSNQTEDGMPVYSIRSVNHIFNPFARVVNMGRCPAITGAPSWPTPSANAIGQRLLPTSGAQV